jgi:hypothetical protein
MRSIRPRSRCCRMRRRPLPMRCLRRKGRRRGLSRRAASRCARAAALVTRRSLRSLSGRAGGFGAAPLAFEITERKRIDAQGQIVTPLDEGDNDAVIERLRRELPGLAIYLSSEIPPEIREFERASTTAACVDVGPLLAGYLETLQSAVSALGLPQMHVMGSSGAVFGIAEGLRMPAMAIESGPAPRVIAAALAAKELGLPNLSIRSFPTRVAPAPGATVMARAAFGASSGTKLTPRCAAAQPDAAFWPRGRPARRCDAALTRIARRQKAPAQQQRRVPHPARRPSRHGNPRLRRLRPAFRPRPGAAARRHGGRLRQQCSRREGLRDVGWLERTETHRLRRL